MPSRIFQSMLVLLQLLLSTHGRGAELGIRPDIHDFYSLQMAFYDDPDDLLEWLKKHIHELDPQREPKEWTKAVLMLGNVMNGIEDLPEGRVTLQKARDLAEAHQLYAEMLLIEGTIEIFAAFDTLAEIKAPTVEETLRIYRSNIERANKLNSPRLQAIYMVAYAEFLQDIGEVNQSLSILVESTRTIEQDKKSSVFDKVEYKGLMARAFNRHGQHRRALQFLQDIDSICQKTFLRFLCRRNDTEMARTYFNLDTVEDLKKAELLAERTLVSRGWLSSGAQAANLLLLTEIALKVGNTAKAVQRSQEFLAILAEFKDQLDQRKGLTTVAQALHQAGRNQESAAIIERAQKLVSPDDLAEIAHISKIAHDVHHALGHYPAALMALQKYVEIQGKLNAKADKDTYQKLMVQMGLATEEQRVKILSQENELQNQKIKETERFRIVSLIFLVLFALIIALMIQSILKSREMRKSRMKIQRILDHIDEGILTINGQLQIDSEYSRHLHTLLDDTSDFTQRPALDLLLKNTALSTEERSILHETLNACLNEDAISWELNEAQLPTELVMNGRSIALNWQPIIDEHRIIRDVILSLRDISNRKILEFQVQAAQQKTEMMTERLRELVNADVDRCSQLLDEMDLLLESWDGDLSIRLHTVKGLARSLGLRALSQLIHETEDTLDREPLAKLTAEYRDVIQHVFRKANARVLNLAGIMSSMQERIQEQLDQAKLQLHSIALDDQWLRWTAEDSRDLEFILIHAISNALDHGFIRPHQQGRKLNPVRLHIETRHAAEGIELIVRDNGIGLDWQRLQEIASEKHFHPASGQLLSDVLFLEGVSTADATSLTSGRGVGLSAIRSISSQRSGQVQILDNDHGRGTMLVVRLPQTLKKAG